MKLIRFALYSLLGIVWHCRAALAPLDALAPAAVDNGAGALFGRCLARAGAAGSCMYGRLV
jgi:hypothetical protein